MRLLLIRHAESEGNAQGRFQGLQDYPLTQRGIEQAVRLAARLRDRRLDHIYTSPLARADHTARIVAEAKGMPIETLPGVHEYDFGHYSGLTRAEVRERDPELAARMDATRDRYFAWPGEEGRTAFRDRVSQALWGLEAKHTGEAVAVFTHGGVIATFISNVLALPEEARPPFMVDNTSVFEVEVRGGRGTLWAANDTCHLRD